MRRPLREQCWWRRVIGADIHGVERRLGTYSDTLGLRHGIVMKRLLKNTMERYSVRVLILLYACMRTLTCFLLHMNLPDGFKNTIVDVLAAKSDVGLVARRHYHCVSPACSQYSVQRPEDCAYHHHSTGIACQLHFSQDMRSLSALESLLVAGIYLVRTSPLGSSAWQQ